MMISKDFPRIIWQYEEFYETYKSCSSCIRSSSAEKILQG